MKKVVVSDIITYKLHTSAAFPSYFWACSISGAAYAYEPQNVSKYFVLLLGDLVANPKSGLTENLYRQKCPKEILYQFCSEFFFYS